MCEGRRHRQGGALDDTRHTLQDLMVGTSNAVADGARAFSDTVRTRADSGATRPLDLMEASSLMTSKVLEAMAKSWREVHEDLVAERQPAPPAVDIDYDKLADLVASKLRAAVPGPSQGK